MSATILIVDDDPQNRELLEALLEPEGYLTVSVRNGEQALAEVSRRPPDLILLDVMMPGMDGYQVAKLLKGDPATSDIPIIMVTARVGHSARLAAFEAGAEGFLTKPYDRAELWLRVRNLLRFKASRDFLQNYNTILEAELEARSADSRRFRAAMDATADGIVLVSRTSMRFVEVNATACKMLGYPLDELLQMGPADLGGSTAEQIEVMYDIVIAGQEMTVVTESVRRKDGSELPVETHRHAQRSGTDWIIVDVMRDITERQAAERSLHHLAHYDALTGLPNRTLFYETLGKTLTLAADKGWNVAVLFLDLDHFKNVNDMLGHAMGDEMLCQFSDRLNRCVRVRDTVGRLGGDEFAVILLMEDSQQGAVVVANKIRDALQVPFDPNGHEVTVTASIGISVFPADAREPDLLIKYANTAMCRAKQAGRDTFRFFTAEMNTEMLARLDLGAALRRAVANEEFVLHYQPKVRLDSGRIAGLEALLRWQRPGHGLVSPADFIPVLEETGLIVNVGSWVIATVCQQIGRWIRSPIGPLQVSVNVSGRQLIEGDLEADVIGALEVNRVPGGLLELELTETSLMANTERTIATLERLKALGVQISIDDFGTGYSSLAYLRRFPIDKLKIDMVFIRDVTSNPDGAAIARTIIRMAHSLKLEVIAEGVETAAQLAYLRRHHCDQIQGYYFSRPLPLRELELLLGEAKCLPAPHGADGVPPKTLLLVDDDVEVLGLLEELLRQDGYNILSARSGAEGLELLALNEVHVLVCDQRMPTMNGSEFLDRAKALHPDTLRIILSAYADLESIMDAINLGSIYRFYKKPWEGDGMRENIRDAFRHYDLLHDISPDGRPPARRRRSGDGRREDDGVTTDTERTQPNPWREHQFVFQAALNAISDAVYLKDAGGRYLAINAAGAVFVGLPPEEIIGRTDSEFFSPESASALRAVDRQILDTGETMTQEEPLETPGGVRVFRSTKGAYVDDAGTVIGVFGISHDITEAKEAEEDRRDLLRALELTVDGVGRVGMDGRFIWVDGAFASLCGSTPAQMVGVPLPGIVHPDDHAVVLAAYADLKEGGRFDVEIRPLCPDGTSFFARMTGVMGHAPDGSVNGSYCMLHDISDQKRADDAAREAGAELERRNGELVSFASLAAHDLRQPLSVIGGFAALLVSRLEGQLDDKARDYAAAICRGTDTMDRLVASLLEFAGDGEAASPGTLVDTARVVADVVTDLQSTLDGGSVAVRGPLPVLPGNPAQLTRLFQNLVGNAVKFRGPNPPSVEVTAELAGSVWMFRVSDNGIGIGPEFVDRLFGMLQRERRGDQPGTGMGLAICRKIVEYHGGNIWLDADADADDAAAPGSTFRFTLPAGAAAG